MSTDNIEQGNDQQPTPKIADKYADYVELNQENDSEAGTSEPSTEVKNTDKTVDDKQEVKESSTETEKPAHKPAWQKRIDKQTAKIRTLEAQLEELRSVKAQKELPKYKRV